MGYYVEESDLMWQKFFIGLLFVVITLVSWVIVSAAKSDHKRGNCYTVYSSSDKQTPYQLKQSVDWEEDDTIGYYSSMDEAVRAAGLIKCPIGNQ